MSYDHLKSRVQTLRKRFDDLQTDIRSLPRRLKNGEPPELALVQRLLILQADFKKLREDILALRPETRDGSELLRTLDDLEKVVDEVGPSHSELHHKACTTLDQVLFIIDEEKGADPLENAHSQARTLRSEIQDHDSGAHPAAKSIANGDHPLAKLCALVTEEERFSDADWESTAKHVRETFPDLAVPLFRGRLQVDPDRTMEDQPSEQDSDDGLDSAEDNAPDPLSSGETETDGPGDRAEPESQREDRGTPPRDSKPTTKGQEDPPDVSEQQDSDDKPAETNIQERSATVEDSEVQDEGDESTDAVATSAKEFPADEGNSASQDSEAREVVSNTGSDATSSAAEASTPTPENVEQAAEILLEMPDDVESQQFLIRQFLQNNLDGLAYCLAESLKAMGAASALPPWLLRAFTLGPHVRTRNGKHGAIAHRLQFSQDATAVLSNNGEIGYTSWLLAFGAVLRPALHAPMTTSVSTLLNSLSSKPGLEPVATYAKHVGDFVQHHHRPADASVFGNVKQDSLATHIRDLSEEIKKWDAHTDKRRASYEAATRTWRTQLRKGPVARLRDALTNSDTSLEKRVDIVESNLGAIEDPDYQKLFREATGKSDYLEGKALSWIKDQFNEVRRLANRWLQLAMKRLKMRKETDDSSNHTEELVENLLAQNESTINALHTFAEENQQTLPGVAARRAAEVVKTLYGHLSGNEPFRKEEPEVHDLLHTDLLRIPDAPLEGDLTEDDHAERAQSILNAFRDSTPGWSQAFETYVERERFDRSRQLLDALQRANTEVGDTDDIDSKKLEERHQNEVHRSRSRVHRRAEEIQHRIEHAFQLGYLDYNDRADLLDQQRRTKDAIDAQLDLGRLRDQLNDIEDVIAERRDASVRKARERFERKEVQQALENAGDADQERIQKALDEKDVYTAHAYIDRLLNNESLPEEKQTRTALDTFFPGRLRAIRQKYEHNADAIHDLIQTLENGDDTARGEQLSFREITSPARKETSSVIQKWQRIQQQEKAKEEDLEAILGALGFEVTDVDITPFSTSATGAHGGRRWAEVTVVPPSKRSCPVPTFGSKTGGSYRFLLSHGSPTVEEIAAGVDLMSVDGKANVALYFGMLDEEDRRELADLCRERETDFIVIDAALFLFTLTYPRPQRLRTLFECALPFTYVQPYSEVGSRVPPEMFFGREREIRKILDQNGPSLVYGGRQLGKTVLLRQAKREFHEPPHRIASWIDLRTQGVVPEETGKIWPILVEDLLNQGVFEKGNVHPNTSPQKIRQRIQDWLDENSTRRILLLLDETDSFFEHEQGTDFEETRRLKGLMEATNGRFKVVFAGLHNVLRVTDSPNQPLGHLSDPICVGPLLDDGEWQAARDLVERPLSALGYEFESDDLITFILSLTNYYPSLIQLYCRYLLEEMLDTSGLGTGREGPPYLIKKTDIRESYGQNDLMRQIQQRFLWTLQLDARYEVLAYAIGYAIKDASSQAPDDSATNSTSKQREQGQGFSVKWVRQKALYWWQDGFRGSSSPEHIEALLDEMVGLGVLRKTEERPSRYTLRSPNVLPLLGSQAEMLETLDKERVVQPEFDPKTHRRIYHSQKLAPLTSYQYGLLTQPNNGVNIIWGNLASGIEQVVPFLRDSGSQGAIRVIDSARNANEFEDTLKQTKENRTSDAVTLAIVDLSAPWGEDWVHRSVDQVNRLRSEHRHFRIVFLADAHRTWSMCDATLPTSQDGERAITNIQLQPWHDAALRTWFLEREQSLTPRQMRKVGRVTGNWPMLLKEMEEAMDGDPTRWEAALDTVRRRMNDPGEVEKYLNAFGLADDIRRNVLSVLADLDDNHLPPDQGLRMSLGTDGANSSGEGIPTEDICVFVEDEHGEHIARKTSEVLEWARRTGSASLVGSDRWRIDPLVGKLLQTDDS